MAVFWLVVAGLVVAVAGFLVIFLAREIQAGTSDWVINSFVGCLIVALGVFGFFAGQEAHTRFTVTPQQVTAPVTNYEHIVRSQMIGKVLTFHNITTFHIQGYSDEFECSGHREWKSGSTCVRLDLYKDKTGHVLTYDFLSD